MELIRGLHNLRDYHRGCVATIGNFDGVHLGHQMILSGVREKAQQLGLPSVVIVFEPQPREFFSPESAPPRLTRFGEKLRLLEAEGVDRVLCLSFNERLRSLSAEAFIDELLLKGLGVKHFVVGDDFRFGCDRRGDYALLKAAGESHGFTVADTPTLILEDERVSSSRVRETLIANNLSLAARLLGRRYRVTGRVQHGQKVGRELGFPTANVRMHKYACPMRGVYTVRAHLAGKAYNAICNVGSRPTLNGVRPVLEVHLLDFSGQLYGELLSVEFLHPMRAEQRFDGLDALREQIAKDIAAARAWFAAANT